MERFDARPLEDFAMWAMLQKGGQRADISQLKKFVDQWVQMTTQKTAGQRGARDLCEAVALVLSGELDKLEKGRKGE